MLRFIALTLILCMLSVSCGRSQVINGINYKPVGLISMKMEIGTYSKKVHYEPCWGNIILGTIFVETIIIPIYFFGFSMFNPISEKVNSTN